MRPVADLWDPPEFHLKPFADLQWPVLDGNTNKLQFQRSDCMYLNLGTLDVHDLLGEAWYTLHLHCS